MTEPRLDKARIREMTEPRLERLKTPVFEIGAPVFVERDEAADACGPFAGASGGTVVDIVIYPEPYPTLYVVRTPGRADFPYAADRLRPARCRTPHHEHNERRPVFLCPDRVRDPAAVSYHASGVAADYDVASAEARQGRRGLLDSGPHAPQRKGKGIA